MKTLLVSAEKRAFSVGVRAVLVDFRGLRTRNRPALKERSFLNHPESSNLLTSSFSCCLYPDRKGKELFKNTQTSILVTTRPPANKLKNHTLSLSIYREIIYILSRRIIVFIKPLILQILISILINNFATSIERGGIFGK